MNERKKTKDTITMLERYRVMGYIEAHCIKGYGPEKQYAQWDDAAKSDQHVADLFKPSIPQINADHVMRMRQEMDLLLEPSRWKFVAGAKELHARLDQLEARIGSLEDQVEATLLKMSDRIAAVEGRNSNPK